MSAHVLYGDSYLVPRELAQLKADTGTADLLEGNSHRLQGSQTNLPELLSICNALPFMDARRLVVVEGLLSTLEGRSGRGRRRGRGSQPTSGTLGSWEGLAEAVAAMPETTLLVFLGGPLTDTNPLLKALTPVTQVLALKPPAGEALARWIKASAEDKGASISPAAIGSLTDLIGGDLWSLDRELEKLSLYASGQRIEEADVADLVHQAREANVFAAVDAMMDGRPEVALRLLTQLRRDGRDASYIIAMVERQLRLLALARDSLDQGVPQRELGARLGGASQFVVRKTLAQARRHSWQDITWRYQRLLEADLAIKQGRLEPDLALELLAADQAAHTHR